MGTWKKITALFLLLSGLSVLAFAKEPPIIGKLGKVVGSELIIEGVFKGGKNSWILVTKVNGNDLSSPKEIAISNLDPFAKIPINTICRFKGYEITYVVGSVVDPKTGMELQQALAGRHFEFKVKEVFVPEGLKIREENISNKVSQ